MEFLPDQALVWLRNRAHGTYLHANDDGVRVSLKPHRASVNTAWRVHRVMRGDRSYVLLHSAAYGRYLALSPETSQVYDGHHANLTVQGVYEAPEQDDVLWVAARVNEAGDNVDILMLHASDRLLRASPWNTFYSDAFVDSDNVGMTMRWVVEAIPLRPEPPVIPRLTDQRLTFRRILYTRADDQGNFNPIFKREFKFYGRSLFQLRADLARQLNEPIHRITLCVRAGSQGRLTPLVIDLPSNLLAMEIIVLTTKSPAANRTIGNAATHSAPSASPAPHTSRVSLRPRPEEAMECLSGTYVRLRSRLLGTYLHANEDGVSVSVSENRASLNTAWRVERVHQQYLHAPGNRFTLQGAAYGRYLAASPNTHGHGYLLRQQIVYGEPDNGDAVWLALKVGGVVASDDVRIRHSRYNDWHIGVNGESEIPRDMNTRWTIEIIPSRVHPPLLQELSAPVPGPQVRPRTIIYAPAENDGLIDPTSWRTTVFRGRSVLNLRARLACLLGEPNSADLSLFVWTDRGTPRIPLVVDLPANSNVMVIGVLNTKSPAALAWRYPDVDAQ